MGLPCGVGCVEGAPRPLRFWRLFSDLVWEATFFEFGAILGGFWEAKMVPKSIFGKFFGKLFFERDFVSIFHRFWEARSMKNSGFTAVKQ